MSAEKFEKEGIFVFNMEGAEIKCTLDDFNRVTVTYHIKNIYRSLTLPINIPFIQILEYEDKYNDHTFIQVFVMSLTDPSIKTGPVFNTLTFVKRLRNQARVDWVDIEFINNDVFEINSWNIRTKKPCSKNAVLRWFTMNLSKLNLLTHTSSFLKFQQMMYTNVKYKAEEIARYNLEDMITQLLPQPTAEEINEYLL